jgi:hypothetical protein
MRYTYVLTMPWINAIQNRKNNVEIIFSKHDRISRKNIYQKRYFIGKINNLKSLWELINQKVLNMITKTRLSLRMHAKDWPRV